eukprot:6288128-Prymnesium_polylepis.1
MIAPAYSLAPANHEETRTPGRVAAGRYVITSGHRRELSLFDRGGAANGAAPSGASAGGFGLAAHRAGDAAFQWELVPTGRLATRAALVPGQPPLDYDSFSLRNSRTGRFLSVGWSAKFGPDEVRMQAQGEGPASEFLLAHAPVAQAHEIISADEGVGRCAH